VFNFEVKDSVGKKILYIRNAEERLLVDDISFRGDSVLIRLPFFESQFRAVLTREGNLEGVWLKRGVDSYQSVPFRAVYGEGYRFAVGAEGAGGSGVATAAGSVARGGKDVSGRWKAVFRGPDGKDTTLRIGEFEQKGPRVTGTFLDAGGDLRYLEGVVVGDSLKLSCFDGGHAYLFTARIEGDSRLTGGLFFAGATNYETWAADKDAGAKLPDEFSITKWKKDAGPLTFSFRDIDGKQVSLGDKRFKGKVVLVQIMGSWCPNCMDETRFLSGFYNEYHDKGVEIIGLAYERSTDFARSQNSLRSFQRRFQVKYPMLITGVSVGDPARTEKTLPQLEKIRNFPTTIFLNRKGEIEKIHTGFSGPGTGVHYEEEKKEFYETVDGLLRE
jgi:thiol-disulfide isomerase/thioredoxin